MPVELPPKLWLPPKPAIIRPASKDLLLASILPGMFPAAAAAAKAGLTTLTQVASGTTTNKDGIVTVSATINAGDLLVLGGYIAGSVPSGSPPFTDAAGGGNGISYRIADVEAGGTTVQGVASGIGAYSAVYVFRGNIPITSVTVGDPEVPSFTDGNPSPITVSASAGTPPLIVLGWYSSSGAINPRTFTVSGSPAKDGEINPETTAYLAYKIYNASPADVVIDMDDEGTGNTLRGCYLACS